MHSKNNPFTLLLMTFVLFGFGKVSFADGMDTRCDYLKYLYKDPNEPEHSPLYNRKAGDQILYETQVRTANAHLDANGQIHQSTIEDMLKPTQNYEDGITVDYMRHKVGATMNWMMPIFPNNAKWALPSAVDTLGSPYAVRDYMHVSGLISDDAIATGRNEFSFEDHKQAPVWGDSSFKKLIKKSNQEGLPVMLDVAFNHFGHNYMFYDYAEQQTVRDLVAKHGSLDDLWDYKKTFDPSLVHPTILDTPAKLEKLAASDPKVAKDLADFKARAPDLKDDDLVRGFNMWRVMTDTERAHYNPANPNYLEYQVPGFYRGAEVKPSSGIGDNFTNNWQDVKFLYHHEIHGFDPLRGDYYENFVRNREYIFRVMNNWVEEGARGFRLDHAADFDSGIGENEWRYIIGKVNYYDYIRQGSPAHYVPPIYMAEDFDHSMDTQKVVDLMTEGYVGGIRGHGAMKDTSFIEQQIENGNRFGKNTLIMRALETHDEPRLLEGTGFNTWSGASFYAIGASTHGTPMMLMGQEFGEPWGLGFRGPDFLRSRFKGEANFDPDGQKLQDFYGKINKARTDPANRALKSDNHFYLRQHDGTPDPTVFAQAKWDHSQGPNAMFTFVRPFDTNGTKNLHYKISDDLAGKILIQDDQNYRLVDTFNNQQVGDCHTGHDLKNDLPINMNGVDRVQWLRLELCK